MHDPIGAFSRIRAFYLSYLDTASRLEGPDIREERRKLLMETGKLCTSPLLEPLPSWQESECSFEDLVTQEGEDAILVGLSPKARRAFVDLIGCGLIGRDEHGKLYRPYTHQIKMLKRGVRDGEAGIVTSGTGSGKTEAFLLPILASIIEEATCDKRGWAKPEPGYPKYRSIKNRWWRSKEDGQPMAKRNAKGDYELPKSELNDIKGLEWDKYKDHEQRCGEKRPAAVRALILYPMNALVEDQMTRLRMALDSQDARNSLHEHLNGNRIFFGRYTGQTKGGPAYLLEHEKSLRELGRGEGKYKLSDIIEGCDDGRTLTQYKQSVAQSKKRRIEDLIIELSRLDDLELAIREEAKTPDHQQISISTNKEIKDKAFAFPSLDGAEMVTRWDMQEYPPDILVTNISMLNAMLSRKTEACMLEKTRKWLKSDSRNRFTLVIDELHLQRGSAGTEFMYLLRLLFVRLGLDRPEHHHQLRLLASSASFDKNNKEASLSYLYDAFADFGLGKGAKKEDWLPAVVPGETKNLTSEARHLSVSHTELNEAINTLMNTLAPEDGDSILREPDFEGHYDTFKAFLDKLDVPVLDSLKERWEWLASAVGCKFKEVCCNQHGSVVATSLDKIAERCWPNHGWSTWEVERNMRLLTYVIGAADHSGLTGKKLRELRKEERWPVPRFRLHTFFRIPQGLFVDVVPPDWRSREEPKRWQGDLSIERTGTTQTRFARDGDGRHYLVRQFELLSCECCGECFIGGIRANKDNKINKDSNDDNAKPVAELLPNEEDIESLPDLSVSSRFEEYSYEDYVVFWPRDKNDEDFNDDKNEEKWEEAWLNPISGVIFGRGKSSGKDREELQPGYLFKRTPKNNLGGIKDESPGSHTPCRCPRCKIDYAPKRKPDKLFNFSPIRSQRSGLAKSTQLLTNELYSVLATEKDNENNGVARLVSFSDSRQMAARTALDVEKEHHRDVLREILLRAILSESKNNQSISDELQQDIRKSEDRISQETDSEFRDMFRNRLEAKKIQLRYNSLGIVPLESILELEPPKPGASVKRFLAELIKLGIHPFCERGVSKLKSKKEFFDWWELFSKEDDAGFKWSHKESKIKNRDQYKELCEQLLKKVAAVIADLVFDRTYFALEATGLAYPVPLPQSLQLKEEMEQELSKAAAWMRIYTDDYRFEYCLYLKDRIITSKEVDDKRSNVAKLLQSAARILTIKDPKNLLNDMKKLMNIYGHSDEDYDCIRFEKIGFRIPEKSDPYWRCNNCRRIHLHRGLDFCTRYGTRLPSHPTGSCDQLQRDNFLGHRLRQSLFHVDSQENLTLGRGVFRLRCEELTGQTIDPASRQREFKSISLSAPDEHKHPLKPEGIEMLSVTTTMEVGVDIGPLEAIMQANMPPQRFNYQQRVGRAGRRDQAFSFVLTLCRSRSHDLHYFRHPESITGDAPPVPFLVKRLPRIAERLLCKDQLIAAFQLIEKKHRKKKKGFWLGDLVKPTDIHGDFIPANTLRGEKKERWLEWLHKALENRDIQTRTQRTLNAMQRGNEAVLLQRRSGEELCKEIIEDIEKVERNTIGLGTHLANYGLLPMYGLPTRVRELVLGPGSYNNSTEHVSRDLEVAIYEYAPGNVLVHDKRDHRCLGLTPRINFSFVDNNLSKSKAQTLSDKPWDRRLKLGQCPKCWAWREIDIDKKSNESVLCDSCQASSFLRDWNSKWCLEPAAFRTDFNPQTKSIDRLPGSSSNSLCADGKPPEATSWDSKTLEAKDYIAKIQLTTSYSTTVYRLNQGPRKEGFNLCWKGGILQHPNKFSKNTVSELNRSRDPSTIPLKFQAIDNRLLNKNDIKDIFVDDTLLDKSNKDILLETPVCLVAPRITDGLYILPQDINEKLSISFLGDNENVPYSKLALQKQNSKSLSGKHYWQGVRAAAISASEILVLAATRHLDIEHRALQAVEPRLFKQGDKEFPLIQIVDEHVNGAGFSDWLGGGDKPPVLKLLSDILTNQCKEWTEEDHALTCQESCYRCLKTYDNQNLHGLLDWRLGLAYLRAFTDPDWMCGLDGNFDWEPLAQWPELSKRIRNDTLSLWNANEDDNKEEYSPLDGLDIYAFRFSQTDPWVIVRHPLWRWGLDEGPLHEFACTLDLNYRDTGNVLCWDTFNLSRRPGRTKQWMQSQKPPQRRRTPRVS